MHGKYFQNYLGQSISRRLYLPKHPNFGQAIQQSEMKKPAEFATRVYRIWMDAGVFSRPELKRLDPLLFSSLESWLKNNNQKPAPEPLPEGFSLLTIAQVNDAWVDRVRKGQAPIPEGGEELARFANALLNRAIHGSERD